MTVTLPSGVASPRQVAFMRQLAEERVLEPEDRTRLLAKLDQNQIGFEKARLEVIPWLLHQPVKPGIVPDRIGAMPRKERTQDIAEAPRGPRAATVNMQRDPATLPTQGIYRLNDETYIIVPTRTPGRHKAKRWVVTPERLTSSGETVNFDWVEAPGVIWALYEEHRLPIADIEAMMVQHRVCIYPGCYRVLKAAKSVRAGVGKRHAERLGIRWGKQAS